MFTTPPRKPPPQKFDYSRIIQYEEGDFIYGLQTFRADTLNGIADLYDTEVALTIDRFTLLEERFRKCVTAEDIYDTAAQLADDGVIVEDDADRLARLIMLLYLSKYATPDDADEDKRVARFCKANIMFCVEMSTKIHFILDGLRQIDVVTKNEPNYSSFTSKELRSVYKAYVRNPHILHFIVFYKNGRRVSAPWLDFDTATLWRTYAAKKRKRQKRKRILYSAIKNIQNKTIN